MDTGEFTQILIDKLETIFPPDKIIKEWDVGKESGDAFDRNIYYTPKVDIAVGSFNIDQRVELNNRKINALVDKHKVFLKQLYDISHLREYHENISYNDFLSMLNKNPRCFLAIEIENTKNPKRSLGSIVNASVMGKIGIVVPLGNEKYEMFVRIKRYFHYLKGVEKLKSNFKNVLIIEGEKLINSISSL
jgi:hypothetical protein